MTTYFNGILKHIGLSAFVIACLAAELAATEDAHKMNDVNLIQVQEAWADGLSSENMAATQDVLGDILSRDDKERTLGAQLLERLLMAEPPSGDVGDEDIVIFESVALHIMSSRDLSRDAARRNSLLASQLLGRLRQEIIPNFSRLPVTANVRPPPGVPGYAGMSPEAITDPAARAEYESAIQANRKNNRINRRQHTLERVEKSIRGHLHDYLAQLVDEASISKDHFERCLIDARIEDIERLRLLNRLKSLRE